MTTLPPAIRGAALWGLVRDTWLLFRSRNAARLAAAIAFHAVFSLGPLVVVVLAVVGFVLGAEAARGELFEELRGLLGPAGAAFVQDVVAKSARPAEGLVASALALAVFVWGASRAFVEIKGALNVVWGVEPLDVPLARSVLRTVRNRVLSFVMVLVIGVLLMVSLLASATITALSGALADVLGSAAAAARAVQLAVSFVLFTTLAAAIFKLLPDTRVGWRDVLFGAPVTAALFLIGQTLLGWYLGNSGRFAAYGAASALVVILLWASICAQIFLFGAAMTSVYARRWGSLSTAAARQGTADAAPTSMTTTTTAAPDVNARARARHDAQDWWVSGFRGLILTFCGLTLLWPGLNLLGVASVFAGMAIMGGAVLLHNARDLHSIVPGLQGLVGFALGVTSILFAERNQELLLVTVVAAWAITSGAFDFFIGRRHANLRGRLLLITGGGLGILGGAAVAIIGWTSEPMAWQPVLALLAIADGVLLMAAGIRRSRRHGYLAATNASRRDRMTEQPERPAAPTNG